MEEVDEESFNVGAVRILIRHDHDVAVAQLLQRLFCVVLIFFAQANDFDNVVDHFVLLDLRPKASTCDTNRVIDICVLHDLLQKASIHVTQHAYLKPHWCQCRPIIYIVEKLLSATMDAKKTINQNQ